MRKAFKLSLTLVLGLSLLVGCSSGNAGNSSQSENTASDSGKKTPDAGKTEKIELSIWHNFAGDDLRAKTVRRLIEEFEAKHPEVELDAQAIPADGYRQRLRTVAAADEMPDVFFVYPGGELDTYYGGGLMQPYTDLLDNHPEWKEGFLPGATERFTFDGEVYSTPINLSATSFLFYNRTLFEKYDVKVPTTWDELMKAVEIFNSNDITPIALGNQAAWPAQSMILGALADRVTGTEWFFKAFEQNGASFTDPEFIEALGYFKQLVDADAFQEGANSIDNTQAEQYFIQGNAAMTISGAWTITNLANAASEEALEQVEVTVLPAIPGGKGKPNTISGGASGGLALSKEVEGAQREAALDLIYTISGPEGLRQIAEASSMVMFDVEIDESKVTPMFSKAQKLISSVEFVPVYDLYLSTAGTEAINNGLQELLMGGDPEAVAKKLQDAHAKALKEAKEKK